MDENWKNKLNYKKKILICMYIYYKKINFNRKKKKLNLNIYYRKKKLIYIYYLYMECYKYISNYLANHSLCSLIEINIGDILYFI